MKKNFTLFLFFIVGFANAQTFVAINDPTVINQRQYIRQTASASAASVDELIQSNCLVISQVITGGTFLGGNKWGKVDIPNTSSATSGYVALGVPAMLPMCNNKYVLINTTINIRPLASTTGNVTINNQPAKVFAGQKFALVSSTPTSSGGYEWYHIYLTNNCSQNEGWIANDPFQNWLIVKSSDQQGVLDAPTISQNNLTSNSITISATNDINYYNRYYDFFINGSLQGNDNSHSGANSPSYVPVTDNLTISNLSSCTQYNVYVKEKNNQGCVSAQSNIMPFTTTGNCNNPCSTPNVVANSNTPIVNGGTLNLTASPSGNYTYSWTGPNGFSSSQQNPSINNFNSSMAGQYCVTMTQQGCSPSQSCTTVSLNNGTCISSVAPISINAVPSTIQPGNNSQLTVVGGTLGTGATWKWYSGTCDGTLVGSGSSITVSPTLTTNYYVRAEGGSCSATTTCAIATVTIGVSTIIAIDINNTVIPPWQRENDDFNGKVSVIKTGNTNALWHLEIFNNNKLIAKYASINGSTQQFFSDDPQISSGGLHFGDVLTYYAVLDANNTKQQVTDESNNIVFKTVSGLDKGQTHIIEKKWEKKNIVYYNNGTEELRIPVKYDPAYAADYGSKIYVKFDRVGKTSWKLSINPLPDAIKSKSPDNYFYYIDNGCIVISPNKDYSNLQDVFPGDIKYTIVYPNLDESNSFDLTKIGKIKSPHNSTKVLVQIGGIFNEIESDAQELQTSQDAKFSGSKLTFSSIEYCREKLGSDYSTWYIAQGNCNFIKRNAHDIGIALERIIKENGNTSEIDLFCHSKGGLDTRAMLSSYTDAYDFATNNFNYNNSLLNKNKLVKKVVFFDTPHDGAILASKLWPFIITLNIPAGLDLMYKTSTISELKRFSINLPSYIQYANINGYNFFIDPDDNIVRVIESINPFTNTGNYISLFQQSYGLNNITSTIPGYNLYDAFHMKIHQSNNLDYHINFDCTKFSSNLQKLVDFLSNEYVGTCSKKVNILNTLVTAGSKLSGTRISTRSLGDSIFRNLGMTDENGQMSYSQLGDNLITDTLKLTANGYDSLLLNTYEIFSSNNKVAVAMIKEGITNKIQYPSLSFVNQVLVINIPSVQIKVTAKHAKSYDISRNIFSASYSALTLNNNSASINLDTGYNKITLRFNGVDTQYQSKEIYYFPDTLYNDYSWDIKVHTTADFLGSKLFVNDKYCSTINSINQNVRVLKGVNQIKFTKIGFTDTAFITDTAVEFYLHLTPVSYSSLTDSSILFNSTLVNPQYWRTITTKYLLSNNNTQISVKQYDDDFANTGLLPQTRKFVFRNLHSTQPTLLKTAIALDQIETPDSAKVYLLNIKNGNQYFKYLPNTEGICEYDQEVQKLAFDNLNFRNNAATEELVLMKKQPPVINNTPIKMYCGETKDFSVSMFFKNPDSIKNDISVSSLTNSVKIVNGMIRITAPTDNTTPFAVQISATHDFLTVSYDFNIKLETPLVYVPTSFTPNGDGKNDLFKPKFYGSPSSYQLIIYNRYGQIVFETEDYTKGWDGRINGHEQTAGTYVWTMKYQLGNAPAKIEKGTVTIIR